MEWHEMVALISGVLALIGLGVSWGIVCGTLVTKVNVLWKLRDDLIIMRDRVETIWKILIEPAIREQFRKEESTSRLTEKGQKLLSEEIRQDTDALLTEPDVIARKDPAPAIINRLFSKLMLIAREKNCSEGVVLGVVEAYIKEKLSKD